jgi:predicted ATPase/DNA-binding SARP family transcriptional activator
MSTPLLKIRLFRELEITLNDEPLTPPHVQKAQWLLAVLALRQGHEVPRDWLAGLLWPDSDEKARRNLRQCLTDHLRPSLGAVAYVLRSPSPSTLMLDEADVWVDVLVFDNALKEGDPATLKQALALYRGPLLENLDNEWINLQRAERAESYLFALETVAKHAQSEDNSAEAVRLLRLVISVDPFRESAYCTLMQALAERGDQAGITRVYRDLRLQLHQELNLAPSTETTTLYRSLTSRAQAPVLPASGQKITGPPRRLPIPLTELIGREQEIHEVVGSLRNSRLVTLTGAGGVGKSRLSIAVGEALLGEYQDGVWFVELAPLADSELIPQSIANALGIREEAGQSIEKTLLHVLACRSLLLIIDNCEHLVEECARIADRLLSACNEVQIVATSRHELGVNGEIIYRVPSLPSPDPTVLPPLKTEQLSSIAEYDAVKLFVQRTRLQRPEFVLTYDNAAAVAKICRWLDGIPLAIELAAARMKALRVEDIAERLHDSFQLLTRGSRTALHRHQTLRATMDWSYDLLEPKSKELLHRLSVFAGGWRLEAAEEVCSDRGIEEWEVLDLLTSLVEQSMVVFEEQEGEARYRLLETTRQYANEKLQESGEMELVRQQHQRFYLALAEQAEPHLTTNKQGDWFRRLEEEHDNLRAAVIFSFSEPCSTAILRFCGHLVWFWGKRGHLSEGRQWCMQALKKASDHNRTLERAKVLNGVGSLAGDQGDFVSARNYCEESLSITREIGDEGHICSALNQLGILANEQGDYAAACAYHDESLSIKREIGDKKGIANSLGNLGLVAQDQGDYVTARAYHEKSLSLMEEIGDAEGIAATLYNLGMVAFGQSDYISAQNYYDRCLSLRRENVNPRAVAGMLINRGHIANVQTDYASAKTYYNQSLSLSREVEDKQGIAVALNALGVATQHQGELEASQGYHTESLSIMREMGYQKGIVGSLCNLGYVAQYQADYASARTYYSESLSLSESIEFAWGMAASHCNLGLISKYQADYVSARAHFYESLSLFRKIKDQRSISSVLASLASLAAALKQTERAALLWGASEALREAIGAPLPPTDQEEYDRDVADARTHIDAETFLSIWLQGHSMNTEQAIKYALEEPSS